MAFEEEERRRPGRPPGRPTGGGLSRVGIGNAMLFIITFGTAFLLWQKDIFGLWLRALLCTAFVLAGIYVVLLLSKTRVTGSSEVLFVVGGFVMFIYFMQPNIPVAIPFQLTPLDLTDDAGKSIIGIPAVQFILIMVGLIATYQMWKRYKGRD